MIATPLRPLSLLLLLSLTGCALPDAGAPPALPLAGQWLSPAEDGAELDRQWWRGFGSPTLDALIEQALAEAPDLRIAAERIAQAEAQLTAAGASLFPSLNASGASNRTWSDPGDVGERSSLGLTLGYELDLWGKNRAERLAADAGLDASRHDYESARLTLTAAVASAWFQWLATGERIRINEHNLALARDNLAIVDAKYRYGAAALSDLRRQRTLVLSQEAALLPLREQARQSRSALAILLGRTPQSFDLGAGALMALAVPAGGPGPPAAPTPGGGTTGPPPCGPPPGPRPPPPPAPPSGPPTASTDSQKPWLSASQGMPASSSAMVTSRMRRPLQKRPQPVSA
ncbi:TolC family protein, partial [Zobellella denitrificans]|uniref:TolC family protein n=1 Tax=Zobellella denitrificans TaxID=347534 RepID=UPI001594F5C5